MKFAIVVIGCSLLSAPAWAGQPGGPSGVIVESTTPETVIVESTTPETVFAARRFGPRSGSGSAASTPNTAAAPWLVWLDWNSGWGRMLQLLLR